MAMNYYVASNGQSTGPFTFDQLSEMHITPETLVWYQGADNWLPAGNVEELQALFGENKDVRVSAGTVSEVEVNGNAGYKTVKTDDNGAESVPPCPQPHLVLAIVSAVIFPLGIAAVVKSALVPVRYAQHRYDDAEWLSRSSKKFSIISIVIGAVFTFLYLLLCFTI